MGVILGIDIGGSSTKIVGLAPDLSVIDMLRVKADDPLTSLYGAMGNFLSTHHLIKIRWSYFIIYSKSFPA